MEPHSSCSGQSGAKAATTSTSCSSSSPYFSARIQSLSERRNDFISQLEFEVESSKSHWTELSGATSDCDSEEEKLPNSVVFEKLKEHSMWGPFFQSRPYELEIGEKIGEGGQAEIFAASGTNKIPDEIELHLGVWSKHDLVVKVFKEGFPLQDLQQLWPPRVATAALRHRYIPQSRFSRGLCWALGAQVLEDGRFAFIFDRYWGDLRKLIDKRLLKGILIPPFSLEETCSILSSIARGMANLHGLGVLHRDLKAANVLIYSEDLEAANVVIHDIGWNYPWTVAIADFESSVGVVGTGFWRAPEVLLALKNGGSKAVKFTQKSDVYSYAMTCYEVITGRVPFEDHVPDVVHRGERPALPDETPSKLKALVEKCWHQDPLLRPSFEEIVKEIVFPSIYIENFIHPTL